MTQPGLRLLIIDDSDTDREIYRRYLQQEASLEWQISDVELGELAIKTIQQALPEVVLLDFFLPDMDGLELLEILKQQYGAAMPAVLMVTGQGDEAIAVQALKAGAEDYLIKGQITPASLQASLEQAYERVQLRAKLRQSEERLKLALDAAQMGTWEWRFPGNRLFCSDQVGAIFGLSANETLPSYGAFFERVHESDRTHITQAVQQAFRENTVCEVEFRILTPDGSVRWLNGKGQFYFAADRRSGRMLGTVTDVTRSKQMEAERLQALQSERLVMQMAQSVRQSLSLSDILQTTVDQVRQFLQTDRVMIFHLEMLDTGKVVTESVGREWISLLGENLHDPSCTSGYIDLYRRGQVKAIDNIHHSTLLPCHVEFLDSIQVKANLVVPILQAEQVWGLLIAHHCQSPRVWQQLEINLLEQLATQVGIALQQAELYQQAQQELQERQQTEEILRQSEERFRLLSAFAPIGIFQTDASGVYLYTNSQWQTIAGLSLKQSLGEDWQQAVHPVDRARVQQAWQAGIRAGEISDLEFRFLTPQAETRWVQVNAAAIQSPANDVLGFVGTTQDITERKLAEIALQSALQKLSFHVENAPLAVIEWDSQMRVTLWSASAERIFGWQAAEVMGKRPTDWRFVYEEDVAKVQAILEQALAGTRQQMSSENRNYTQSGAVIYCEWYNSTMTNAAGEFVSMLSFVLDVSHRVQLETEREEILRLEQEARTAAERANRTKDDFLAIVSHEVRSPLTPILGWAGLLQARQFDAKKTSQALATIERCAKLQIQLIDDLLDISRILRGKLSLSLAPIDLAIVIRSAIETMQDAATAKSIQIRSVLPQVGRLSGDATRLQQVVWNLLSNAIKFTPSGGQITVELRQMGDLAELVVIDNGKGIKAEFLPYMFESFRQEDAKITREHGGLGLGLAIVRHLVEAHSGTIQAESEGEGKGAKFTVTLPLLWSNPIEETEQIFDTPLDLTGMHVLAVDDDPACREIVAAILEQYGAIVQTAASSTEFIEALSDFQPDVLISDIGMPQVDGYRLIQQVRSRAPEQGGNLPAIALTAYAGEADGQRARDAGFQIHLSKPVEPESLVQAVLALRTGSL